MNSPGIASAPVRSSPGSEHQRIFAVMLNWNSYALNAPCIASIKKSALPVERIIVVDNGSTDGSLEKLQREFHDTQMEYIRNQRNEGFARGVNIGACHALRSGASMVFLVNNDTIVGEECIEKLAAMLASDPSGGVAGPAIMYHSRPDSVWQAGGFFSAFKMGIKVPGKGKNIQDLDQAVSRVEFLTGCGLLVKSTTLETVGLLDPDYFFYGDDVDYCLRVRRAGLHIYFVPAARMWHKIEDIAADRTSPYVLYHLARSTVIMLRKRFSGAQRLYGIALQYLLYTPFRFWQVFKGRSTLAACTAWLKGLWAGSWDKIQPRPPFPGDPECGNSFIS